jgi:iron complex outermembrane recepter protein
MWKNISTGHPHKRSGTGTAPKPEAIASGLAMLACLAVYSQASAQGTAAQPAGDPPAAEQASAQEETTGTLEEVLVTAQFRSENLQETPIAITAYSAEMLESRSLTNITQVTGSAPNVTLLPAGQGFGASATAAIRGVGQTDFNFAFEPGVGMYVDDVYYSTLFGSIFDLLDLERVEILRGPQGTLAGKNSIGGAVKLFSKKPDGAGGGYLEATHGQFDRLDIRASGEFTLVPDKLFARLSGVSKQRDGYQTRYDYTCLNPGSGLPSYSNSVDCKIGTAGGQDVHAARGVLRWVASPDLEVTVSGDVTEDKSEVQAATLLLANRPDLRVNGVPFDSRFITGDPYVNYATFFDPATGFAQNPVSTVSGWGSSATVDWNIVDDLALKSITAYRQYSGEFAQDQDVSPLVSQNVFNEVDHHQFSQEMRLSGAVLDRLDWTVGAFYFDSKSNIAGRKVLYNAPPPVLPPTSPPSLLQFLDNDPVESKSKSAFLHTVWHITDRLDATGGVRYTDEEKSYTFTRLNLDGTPNATLGTLNGLTGVYEGSKTDYRIGVDYRWTPALMTYAQVSTGFKGGGVNPRPFFANQVQPFDPETLKAYEIGLKSDLLGRTLRINASAFFNDFTDIQLTRLTPPPIAQPVNAGEAEVKGVEIEATLRPIDGLTIDATASWLDFEFTSISPTAIPSASRFAPGIVPVLDNPPNTPKYKGSLGVQYALPIGGAGTLTPRLDATYQARMYGNFANSPLNEIDSFTLVNARLAWASDSGAWETALAVTNLTDEEYLLNLSDFSAAGIIYAQPSRPREWAISVKRNFE